MLALARLPQTDADRDPQTALGQRLASVLSSPGAWQAGHTGLWGLRWSAVLGLCADHAAPAGAILALAGRAERVLLAALSLNARTARAGAGSRARWDAARAADPVLGDPDAYEWIDETGALVAPPAQEALN
jgi:hypothetical protein